MTRLGKKLLLIADDYDHVAAMIAELVEMSSEFDAVPSVSGAKLLLTAAACKPDFCVLDFDMPEIDGLATAKALRAMFRRDCPVLIATTSGHRNAALSSGAFDYVIPKPVDYRTLVRLLVNVSSAA